MMAEKEDSRSPNNNDLIKNTSTSSSDSISKPKKFRENFDFLKVIGEGSFSTVHLAKEKKTQSLFAIKECYKSQIIKEKKVKYVHLEKRILAEFLNNHSFFVQLCFTFQDEDSLYFGLSYCSNGDLLAYIKKSGDRLQLNQTQFYTAELTDALEFMHSKKIVHRDLKPENILLDDKLHIKLTDFGTARILGEPYELPSSSSNSTETESTKKRRNSFVGTAQFVAPEILQGKEPTIACDLWALGCIVFQMLTGTHLFTGSHEYDIFQKVIRLSFTLPEDLDANAQDLIRKLVVTEPSQRLGAIISNETQKPSGYSQLKAHEFFRLINWTNLNEQVPPSYS